MNPGEKFGFSVIVEAIPAVNTNNQKIWKNVRIRKITSSLSYADENQASFIHDHQIVKNTKINDSIPKKT